MRVHVYGQRQRPLLPFRPLPLIVVACVIAAAPASAADDDGTTGAAATEASPLPEGALPEGALPEGAPPEAAVASVFASPYAGAADDAFAACCAAGYCTFVAINECSLLTPAGKVLAMMSAAVGGLGGFMVGAGFAFVSYSVYTQAAPTGTFLDNYKTTDTLLTIAFLTGGLGIVTGGLGGALVAFMVDWWVLQPLFVPRQRTRYYNQAAAEVPPSSPGSAGRPALPATH